MIALWLALSGFAQDASCTLITSADDTRPGRVATGTEVLQGGAVVIEADRIVAVGYPGALGVSGTGPSATWNGRACTVVDLSGHTLTAGFVAVANTLGIGEIDQEPATRDDVGAADPIRAALRASDAYNPRSVLIPVTRHGGVTSAVVVPGGGFVSGQAAWADLAGETVAEAVKSPSVGVVANLDGESKPDALLRLRELFDDAAYYDRRKTLFDENKARPLAASRLDLEALRPVLVGEEPLIVGADRATDIEALLAFATDRDIRLVIVGGAEAWLLADALAAADVAIVLDPTVYGAGTFDQVYGRPDNAALLAAAGVDVMLSNFDGQFARVIPQYAGIAVRGGLSWEDALRAVTITPADTFRQPELGRITVGAVANVVLWGSVDPVDEVDPFETSSKVDALWIGGEPIPLETRQTELRDRYLKLPGTPPAPLPLP